MQTPDSNEELGRQFRELSVRLSYSPHSLIKLTEEAAEYSRRSVVPNFPPFPELVAELNLAELDLEAWPDWARGLIPADGRVEKIRWPDGKEIIRLLSSRGLVLAAVSPDMF
jgi:hypothetical protein